MVSFSWWPKLPEGYSIIWVTSIVIITLSILPRYLNDNRSKTVRLMGYFTIGVIVAWLYCNWIGHQYIQNTNSVDFHRPIKVIGEVASLHHDDIEHVNKIVVKLLVRQVDHKPVIPFKIRLNWYYPNVPVYQGQDWQFLVKLKPARGLANEAGFDYHRYLIGQGISATGYIKANEKPVLLNDDISMLQRILIAINTGKFNHQPWINALILGYKHDLTKSDKVLIRHTGTAHLFVISGLHIGIVAGWIYYIFHTVAKLGKLVNRQAFSDQYVLLATLIGTWGYCYLLGFTIPMLRAFIVLLLCLYIHYKQLNISMWHKYLLCLCGVLVSFPLSSFNTGFWLSFLAVSAISIIVHCLSKSVRSLWDKVMAFIMIQIALTILLFPINIVVFGQIFPWSILANLWAIPIVTLFLVPVGMMLLCMYLIKIQCDISSFDSILNSGMWLLNMGFNGLISGLHMMTQLPILSTVFAPVNISLDPVWCVALLMGIVVFFVFYKQWRLWGWCLLLIPAGMSVWEYHFNVNNQHDPTPNITFTVFDVGQGSSALLLVNDSAYVFDVGNDFGESFNMVNSVLLPYVNAQPHINIKALYISHFDKDHAGGIPRFITYFPLTPIYSTHEGCRQGQSHLWPNDVKVDVLWPPHTLVSETSSSNNMSCVVRVSLPNGQHILVTGDIEKSTELTLAKSHDQGDINLHSEILIVPHHGSKTSSTTAFIERVQPEYALVSVGFMNRYDLPNDVVMKRYHDANITVLSTEEVGQITLSWMQSAHSSMMHISTVRGSEFDPWYRQRWYGVN